MVGKTPQVREIVFNVLDDNGERTVVAKGATTVDVGDTQQLFTRTSNLEVLSSNNFSNISNVQSNIVSIEAFLSQFSGSTYSPLLLTLQNDHVNNVNRIDTLITDLTANATIVDGTYSNVTTLQTDTESNAVRLSNLEDYHNSNVLILNDTFSNVITLQEKQETDFSNITNLQGQIESVTNFGDITGLQANVADLRNRVALSPGRIGIDAGSDSQGSSLAFGNQAGNFMGNQSIAIGNLANYNGSAQQGFDTRGSIVINATGGILTAPRDNTLVISPLQEDNSNIICMLGSNVQTNEITRTSLLKLMDSNVHISTNVSIANNTILLRPDGNGSFGGNIDIHATLDVGSASSFGGAMTLNNNLETIGTSSFGGKMEVNNDIDCNGQSFIMKNGNLDKIIFRDNGTGSFSSGVDVNGSLDVGSPSTFGGSVTVNNNLEITGTSSFGGNMTMNNNVNQTGGSFSMFSTLPGASTETKNVEILRNGNGSFLNTIEVGAINCTGSEGYVDIYHATDNTGLRVGTSSGTFYATINQLGQASFAGETQIDDTLTVADRATLNGGLSVSSAAASSFAGTCSFVNTTSFGGVMTVNNDISIKNATSGQAKFSMFGDDGTTKNVEIDRDGNGSFRDTIEAGAINCTGSEGYVDIYHATANTGLRVGTDTQFKATINQAGNGSFAGTMGIGGGSTTGGDILNVNGNTIWNYNGVERCKLTVGSTTTNSTLSIGGNITTPNASIGADGLGTFTQISCSQFNNNATFGGTGSFANDLDVNGDVTASDFVIPSDERLKSDIKKIPKALDKVKQLSGYTYTINEKPSVGVIAQEVLKILPETIATRDDGYYAVSYHGLIGLLIEAVKELSEKVK
jgi:hypothetical protein